ncbi:MAG: transposase [Nostoc sp.]|uniref:transposase n=1 Tax=Nostoc sp. TaxID=1180 RepID=UPI002FF72758
MIFDDLLICDLVKLSDTLTRTARPRSVKGSSNRVKAKIKLARTYERITNLRDDFLHKLSTRLIKENSIICVENLPVMRQQPNDYSNSSARSTRVNRIHSIWRK